MLISKDIMYAELVSFFLSLGVSIIQSGQELHGKERFVADGLMTEGECQKLISLLEVRNHEVYVKKSNVFISCFIHYRVESDEYSKVNK